nr:hypothetical protein [Tanacetum cinerariifolium]
ALHQPDGALLRRAHRRAGRRRAGGCDFHGDVGDPGDRDEPVQCGRSRAGVQERLRFDHQPVREILQAFWRAGRLRAAGRTVRLGRGDQGE